MIRFYNHIIKLFDTSCPLAVHKLRVFYLFIFFFCRNQVIHNSCWCVWKESDYHFWCWSLYFEIALHNYGSRVRFFYIFWVGQWWCVVYNLSLLLMVLLLFNVLSLGWYLCLGWVRSGQVRWRGAILGWGQNNEQFFLKIMLVFSSLLPVSVLSDKTVP